MCTNSPITRRITLGSVALKASIPGMVSRETLSVKLTNRLNSIIIEIIEFCVIA